MKRTAIPFLLAATIAVGVGFSSQRDPSIEADAFENQFRGAVQGAGFAVVNESAASKEEVPLPVWVQWHPRRWNTNAAGHVAAGMSDAAEHFGLVRDRTSRVDCFVRFLDGRAQFIAIRAVPNETLAAANLRTTLAERFPGFPVRIEIQ